MLNAIFNEFLRELQSNQDLKERIAKIIITHTNGPHKVSKRRSRRMPGQFDSMVIYRESPETLKLRLEALEIHQLKDIVAENGIDLAKLAMKWKSKIRFIDLILSTIESRAQMGDAFRRQPVKEHSDGNLTDGQ